ncbi:hypothetical protein [Pseudomonas sp. MYb185]|uniref:hypothetical protein n=1 Tax=Pseudomonas sp. MYb185 TaxID=1848729 RepID=UPI002115B3EA|nr:hypothetical protein [Pseudomonas sp. MYb185]
MNSEESKYYSSSAYRSNAIPTQPPHRWQEEGQRGELRRIPLKWGSYVYSEPWQLLDMQLQPEARFLLDEAGEDKCYLTHKIWRFENSNKLLMLHPYLKYIAILFGPWIWWLIALASLSEALLSINIQFQNIVRGIFFPLCMVTLIGLSFWHIGSEPPRYKRYFIQAGLTGGIALLGVIIAYPAPEAITALWCIGGMLLSIFMGFIGWDFLFDRYLRWSQHDGSGFNRQTGMVTFHRRFAGTFSAPFYEFDASLEYRPGPHGSGGFSLWLHHRYAYGELFLGGKLHGLDMAQEEAMALWDTLQRYMDVTQPLPDLPILEQFRHLDPTTAEHDRKVGRDPQTWRKTTYRRWSRLERPELTRRHREMKWQQQPCILRAKIDPSLNRQDYYAMQEAKGIVMQG